MWWCRRGLKGGGGVGEVLRVVVSERSQVWWCWGGLKGGVTRDFGVPVSGVS